MTPSFMRLPPNSRARAVKSWVGEVAFMDLVSSSNHLTAVVPA
jgi:hypothetical protein